MPQAAELRVRFAPSPTGRLHVGGARTALFNWLLARHAKGKMILRIEDTDIARSTRASEESLLEDLAWLGLDWDEGPDVGGPHAPYRQSERRELYSGMAAGLVNAGHAYACFCSDAGKRDTPRIGSSEPKAGEDEPSAEGDEPREDSDVAAESRGACPCASLAQAAAQSRIRTGEAHAVRFRVRAGVVEFEDRIRGAMRIDSATFGDFVLLRSSGLPTYNFACVVDDSDMRITHVVRGEDHLYNTARQSLLYDALAQARPQFVHLALILDEDRGKLSKREGRSGTYVDEYRTQGFLPAALVNFLALLGWSSPRGEELLSPDELVRDFDLDRVSKSPAVFDPVKLEWMAAWHMRSRSVDDLVPQALAHLRAAGLDMTPERTRAWIAGFKADLPALGQLPARVRGILDSPVPNDEAAEALAAPGARRLLDALAAKLEARAGQSPAVDGQGFKQMLQECGQELGVRGRYLFAPVRAALSGRTHGPELPLLFDALGIETVRARLGAASD